MTEKYIIDRIVSLQNLSAIVFVDGDNCSGFLKYIAPYCQLHNIYVVAALRYGATSRCILDLECEPWFSVIYSSTQYRDAADHTLGICAASINMMLLVDIPFFIVTSDKIANEIAETISKWSARYMEVIDPRKIDNIVLGLYSGIKLHISLNPFPKYDTHSQTKDNKDIISLYYKTWPDTHEKFCIHHNINIGSFESWRRGRKDYVEGREAVVNYLSLIHTKTDKR